MAIEDQQLIIEALERICSSKEFDTKPVIKKLLTFLVTEYLAGRSNQLKGYTIGLEVFDMTDGFETNQNPIVRINAGRLRALLKTYYLDEGINDPIHIDIPKGGYRPVITKREPGQLTGLASQAIRSTSTNDVDRTIVVAPFKNISEREELDYLANGFALELSDLLTKFDDLRVFALGVPEDDDKTVAKLVHQCKGRGIRFLIDGQLRTFGKRTKLGVKLIDTTDNIILWGHSFKFDLENDDLFDIQENIAQQIANRIGGAFGLVNQLRYKIVEASRPHSLNEQDVLLKFYHHNTILTADSAVKFHEATHNALEKEPDSALLNVLAGSIYLQIYSLDFPGADEAYKTAGDLIEKAYRINPHHSFIRGTLASKYFFYNERERFFDIVNADKEWIANSSYYLGTYAHRSCLFGDWTLGMELLDRVFDNSLFVAFWLHTVYSLFHYRNHDFEKALLSANKCQRPGFYWAQILRLIAFSQMGRLDQAEQEMQLLLKSRADFLERGRHLIDIQIKDAELNKQLLEGFELIGVKLT